MSIVLVTGARGFIGSHVVNSLLKRGDTVIGVDLKPILTTPYDPPNLIQYRMTILDRVTLDVIMEKHRPTHICHLAAKAGVRDSLQCPQDYVDCNIQGMIHILEMAVKYQTPLVYASSSSVYGKRDTTQPMKETDPTDQPLSPYAVTKKTCELMAYTYHSLYSISCTGLRFFTVYGPGGRPDMAPLRFMRAIQNGQEITQYGDGTSCRDYTYVDDIVDGVLRSLDRPMGYAVFNLGTGTTHSLTDFIKTLEHVVDKPAIIRELPNQKGDVAYTCADIQQAREQLGYRPQVTLEEGIRRMYHNEQLLVTE